MSFHVYVLERYDMRTIRAIPALGVTSNHAFHIQVLMSRDTILTFSYHIANDTRPDEHYRIAVRASPDSHCVITL